MPNLNQPRPDSINIAFTSPGHLSTGKTEDTDPIKILQKQSSPNRLEAILAAYTEGRSLTPVQNSISSSWRKFMFDPVFEVVGSIGMVALTIVGGCVILRLCWGCRVRIYRSCCHIFHGPCCDLRLDTSPPPKEDEIKYVEMQRLPSRSKQAPPRPPLPAGFGFS